MLRLEINSHTDVTTVFVMCDSCCELCESLSKENENPSVSRKIDEWLHGTFQNNRRLSSRTVAGDNLDAPREGQTSLE